MKKLIEYTLIGVFSVVLVVAGYQLYKIWNVYHEAEQEYETLQQFVKEPEKVPERKESERKESEEQHGQEQPETTIDFESLKQINPDIVAWIRIEAAGIDYPVVQGEDNDYYLHHTFRGESSIAGSIFMDYRNQSFMDKQVILYGHNMRDGSMFAKLKKLDVIEKPVVVVYTSEEILQYQLEGEDYVSPTDEIYQLEIPITDQGGNNKKADESKRIMILSTCNSDAFSRHIFSGKLIKNYTRDM